MTTLRRTIQLLALLFLIYAPASLSAQCAGGETSNSYCYDDTDVNVVGFEFCPTAGMIAQSDINQGTFTIPFGTLTVYEGTSGSGTGGTIVFGPADGDVSGNQITASSADLCLIFVFNGNPFGADLSCADGIGELPVQTCSRSISPAAAVAFTALADICLDADIQTGLSGGTPTGGVYSGPGVTDNGNGMTYTFDPAVATAGTKTLTYTFMATPATDNVTVIDPMNVTFTALDDRCYDAGTVTGVGNGSPTGGTYSGPGVTDDGNGMTYTFSPQAAGVGMHTITYSVGGGTCSASDVVEVTPACGCSCGMGATCYFHCYNDNEANLVIFEICPSAGMAATATIEEGFYGDFQDNLRVYQGVSGSGMSGTLIFGPANGNLAGTVITATEPDLCLIFVNNTDPIYSCASGDVSPALHVCGSSTTPVLNFIAPDDLCVDAGEQNGLSGGTPSGGVYSGPGVIDDENGLTYSFDPAIAGAGLQTLTYTLAGMPATDDVTVLTATDIGFTALASLCLDAGIQNGLGGGTPTGGVYSGPGVTDDGNGMTYSFNPNLAGEGLHTLTYSVGGSCEASDDVEVTAACSCSCGPMQTCYFHCYNNDENNLVIFEVCPSTTMAAQATIATGFYGDFVDNLTVYQGASGSGTTGTIVFGPANGDLSGTVITATELDQCLIFVSNSDPIISCMDGFVTDPLEVCGSDVVLPVTFTAPADMCLNAGEQTGLGGGTPEGGVYSGPGVIDDENGMTYSFDPATAGVGTHTLTYTFTFGNGASVPANDDVEVFDLPMVTFTAPADLCIDAGIQTGLGGDTPTGGVYSGPGVTDGDDGMTYAFNPATAGAGMHTLTYTFTDGNGCTNSHSDEVEVFALPIVIFTAPADLCINAGVQAGLGGGTPTDGVYSGPGVTDDGNGLTYSFDPAMAGIGAHILTYTFTDGNGCTNSHSDEVEVLGIPTVTFTALDDLCINAGVQTGIGGGTPTGGVYSGPGVIDDENGMTYSFDPATAGVGSHTLTYIYSNGAGCTESDTNSVVVFAKPIASIAIAEISEDTPNDGIVCNGDLVTLTASPDMGVSYQWDADASNATSQAVMANPIADTDFTVVVTDGNGCTDQATASITVDHENPMPVCQNMVAMLDAMGNATIAPADVFASGMDNCGTVNPVSVFPNSFTCSELGPNMVTLTVNDGNGNTNTCTATVTVQDDIQPTLTCIATHTEYLDGSGAAAVTLAEVVTTNTDNCATPPSIGFTNGQTAYTCSDEGQIFTVTVTSDDGNGNTNTCNVAVTVLDNTQPNLVCVATQNEFLDASGSAALTLAEVVTTNTDNCAMPPSIGFTNGLTAYSCANAGQTIIVTVTSDDGNGNTNTCDVAVTISDTSFPVATCQPATVYLDASGNGSISPADVNNGSSDNCPVSLSLDISTFGCANIGASNTVMLTATDPSGNANSCSATVTVFDNLPPVALCQNATVYLDANGMASVTTAQVNNNSSDNCGILNMSISPNSFTCNELGANNVTLTVNDVNGNTNTCNATVMVLDNIPAVIACQNIVVSLDQNGAASITPAQVFDMANSSDNCGSINLVSVYPNLFDCGEIGDNITTLKVNDGYGNISSCQATVTVNPFITDVVINANPESCGMGNGSILITANSIGGQLAFSINGGISWQFSGVFNNVPAGNYIVVLQAFGTFGCITDPVIVTVASAGGPQIWYKDLDGDGFTDGLTVTACVQPLGYVAAALPGDCNDNNADEHPGQIWYKDLDNDGFTDGTTVVSCSKPTGYKLNALAGDCLDTNANVHPGASEICNGLDDDCNGQIDEGLSDQVYLGNVTFSNQAQVNAWSHCYTVIKGNLTIQFPTIDSLNTLRNLRKVTGNVSIKSTGLDSLSWLMNLDTIGGNLLIQANSQLQTLHGLDSLKMVGGALRHYYNYECDECCAIYDLLNSPGGIVGSEVVYKNKLGCNSIPELNQSCDPNFNFDVPIELGQPIFGQLQSEDEQGILVYPNPTSGLVNVQLEKAFETGNLRVFDAQGRLVYAQKFDGQLTTQQFELAPSAKGLFFVEVTADGEVFVEKLMVN